MTRARHPAFPDWLTRSLAQLASNLTGPEAGTLNSDEVEQLWLGWTQTASRAAALPRAQFPSLGLGSNERESIVRPLRNVLLRLAHGGRALAVALDPEGRVRLGSRDPRTDALMPAFELLDYAMKGATPHRVFRRLRRCPLCTAFFYDRRGQAIACVDCRAARRRALKRTPVARMQARRRVERYRAVKRGLTNAIDAPPRQCRAPDLLTRDGRDRRLTILKRRYNLSHEKALATLDIEVNRIEE